MHKDVAIYDELVTLSPTLAEIPCINVFSVPDDYFTSLASAILFNINKEQSIIEFSRSTPNSHVPEGYFDGLADQIMNRIRSGAENDTETDFLAAAKQHNVYAVPAFYFETLADDILKKIPQPANVVEMKSRYSIFRYAVAACIIGILGLSLFNVFNHKTGTEIVPQQSATVMAEASRILKENAFDKVMETVSDEEIVKYLQSSGEDVNAALVASVTDEKILPEATDYIDEKTLDNFLKELNISKTHNN